MWLHWQRRGSKLFFWKERRDQDFFCWGQKMRKPFFRQKLMSWSWKLFSGVYLTSNRYCNSNKCTDYRVQYNGVVSVQLQINCTPKRAVICTTSRLDIEKRWVDIWPSFSIYRVVQKKRNVFSNLVYSRLTRWVVKIFSWIVVVVVSYLLMCFFRQSFVSQAETMPIPRTGIFWFVRKQTSDVIHAKGLIAYWEAWEVSKRT